MIPKVKVIGAGSIGNHLAHGCRAQGWAVTIVDLSQDALSRTRDTIYPSRYGSWDEEITLATPDGVASQVFDLVIVGTPPATHLGIAKAELKNSPPKVLLIEKPLSHPNGNAIREFIELAGGSPTRVLVGYNQRSKPNTKKFLELARDPALGKLVGLSSEMLESWDGILKAHFWMASEKDSYLAFTNQGGGALLEHSHALNLMLYLAGELEQGDPVEVSAKMHWVDHDSGRYDRDCALTITLESGLKAQVRQDLRTWPARKEAVATFENGSVIWTMGDETDSVTLRDRDGNPENHWEFPKTRPDDFLGEIAHLGELLAAPKKPSSLSLEAGVQVMEVALAAIESSASQTPVSIVPLKTTH